MTDQRGNFELEIDCNCEYEIGAVKEDFDEGFFVIESGYIDCDNVNTFADLELEPKADPSPAPVVKKEEIKVVDFFSKRLPPKQKYR